MSRSEPHANLPSKLVIARVPAIRLITGAWAPHSSGLLRSPWAGATLAGAIQPPCGR
jgi:hypothetical protein